MGFDDSIVIVLAIGTSLASIFFSAVSSALSHHHKSSVEWSLVIPLSIGMIIGAVIGAEYASSLTSYTLKWIVTIFLFIIGLEMIMELTQKLANSGKGFLSLAKYTLPVHGSWIGLFLSLIHI